MSIDPNFNKFTYEHYTLFPSDGQTSSTDNTTWNPLPIPRSRSLCCRRFLLTQRVCGISITSEKAV